VEGHCRLLLPKLAAAVKDSNTPRVANVLLAVDVGMHRAALAEFSCQTGTAQLCL
jgi:hypothetical protein